MRFAEPIFVVAIASVIAVANLELRRERPAAPALLGARDHMGMPDVDGHAVRICPSDDPEPYLEAK
jgi:hypothetical protein